MPLFNKEGLIIMNNNNYNEHINNVMMQQFKSATETKRIKQQFRHDWKITIFNVLGGAISGLITSVIFWLITK